MDYRWLLRFAPSSWGVEPLTADAKVAAELPAVALTREAHAAMEPEAE